MGKYRYTALSMFLNWLPALFALCVIAGESTATMSSEHTSRWLLPLWTKLFGAVTASRWEEIHLLIRKCGHFVGYGLLSLAFYRGWRKSLALSRRFGFWSRRIRIASLAVLSTLLVASADEYHQNFLAGRTSSPYDVCLDVCGAIAAHLLLFLVIRFFWRRAMMQAIADGGWA